MSLGSILGITLGWTCPNRTLDLPTAPMLSLCGVDAFMYTLQQGRAMPSGARQPKSSPLHAQHPKAAEQHLCQQMCGPWPPQRLGRVLGVSPPSHAHTWMLSWLASSTPMVLQMWPSKLPYKMQRTDACHQPSPGSLRTGWTSNPNHSSMILLQVSVQQAITSARKRNCLHWKEKLPKKGRHTAGVPKALQIPKNRLELVAACTLTPHTRGTFK